MKHLFIVTLFSILHLNYGFQNLTGIEKAKFDIAKLLESQHLFKRRIKRQAQVKLDYPLTNHYINHRPNNPQFKKLMKQMNTIIPAKIVNPDFIQSTQDILEDLRREKSNDVQLNLKLDDLESILIEDNGGHSGSLRTALIIRKLSELFAHLDRIQRPNGKMDAWSLAPFVKLGEDCFLDVNHKQFTLEIKQLALAMQDFIEYRVMDNQKGAQYKMDEMMVDLIKMVFQLHRATLRNWNHILMVVSNFAYMQNGKSFKKFFI